jgi:thiamine-phosphate pyrophosphorylase
VRRQRRPAEAAPDGNWIEPEEAGCRLALTVTARSDLGPLLAFEAVAAILVEVGDEVVARAQVAEAHRTGRAALLVDRLDLVRPLGADGVHLNRPAEVAAARQLLDRGELIGAACGHSRHDAMVAGEDGADYVLFGIPGAAPAEGQGDDAEDGASGLAGLVAWWSEVAVLPVMAAGRFTADDVGRLARAGADFLLPTIDGEVAGLEALARALAAAQR